MNRYDEVYDFRLATRDDVDDIMHFIHEEWSENHILAYDRELFIWQYGRTEYNDEIGINVVLMCRKDGTIVGMIGFVPYSDGKNELHISTAITVVKSKGVLPMSGLELMKRQMALVGENGNFASGTNSETILPIFERIFHHRTGVMQQYYILDRDRDEFSIAIPDPNKKSASYIESDYRLCEIDSFSELRSRMDLNSAYEYMSIKGPEYIEKRFFKHPYYIYKKWLVLDGEDGCVGVLFGREISVNGAKCLRLVDYRGRINHLEKLGSSLHRLLKKGKYEYIDLMVSDLSFIDMKKSGFELLDVDGREIIPHYFEPFERENKRNYFQTNLDLVIFKADGDQDRPNLRKDM